MLRAAAPLDALIDKVAQAHYHTVNAAPRSHAVGAGNGGLNAREVTDDYDD